MHSLIQNNFFVLKLLSTSYLNSQKIPLILKFVIIFADESFQQLLGFTKCWWNILHQWQLENWLSKRLWSCRNHCSLRTNNQRSINLRPHFLPIPLKKTCVPGMSKEKLFDEIAKLEFSKYFVIFILIFCSTYQTETANSTGTAALK